MHSCTLKDFIISIKKKEKGFHHFYKTVIQNESRQAKNIKPAFIVKTGDYVVGQWIKCMCECVLIKRLRKWQKWGGKKLHFFFFFFGGRKIFIDDIKRKRKTNAKTEKSTSSSRKDSNLFICIYKVELFNYVLALFHDKFSCNSAFRNPVLRWE